MTILISNGHFDQKWPKTLSSRLGLLDRVLSHFWGHFGQPRSQKGPRPAKGLLPGLVEVQARSWPRSGLHGSN